MNIGTKTVSANKIRKVQLLVQGHAQGQKMGLHKWEVSDTLTQNQALGLQSSPIGRALTIRGRGKSTSRVDRGRPRVDRASGVSFSVYWSPTAMLQLLYSPWRPIYCKREPCGLGGAGAAPSDPGSRFPASPDGQSPSFGTRLKS